ncbi:MAG: ribonuclease P protein component [Acidobacteria bacterium]|nr:ribonuclease P protein component [Acidobacteriota bacterium]
MPESFRPSQRVTRRSEFQRIQQRGTRLRGRFMTLMVLPNGRDVARLGIIATRKLGGAVDRNRAKRLIREVFRKAGTPKGFDVVVLARQELLEASLSSLETDYAAALGRYRPDRPA